jgi:hypothetical protein
MEFNELSEHFKIFLYVHERNWYEEDIKSLYNAMFKKYGDVIPTRQQGYDFLRSYLTTYYGFLFR